MALLAKTVKGLARVGQRAAAIHHSEVQER